MVMLVISSPVVYYLREYRHLLPFVGHSRYPPFCMISMYMCEFWPFLLCYQHFASIRCFHTESPGKSVTGQPCSLRQSELSSDADEDSTTTFSHHNVLQPEHRAPHSCLPALISHATTTTTWYVSVLFFLIYFVHFVCWSGLFFVCLFVFGCLFIWFVCLLYAFLLDLPTRGGWSYDGYVVCPCIHRKLWSGFMLGKRRSLRATGLLGIH